MNIMITGASRGIGLELVKYYARINNNHVFALTGNMENLKKATCDFPGKSNSSVIYPVDFSSDSFMDYPDRLISILKDKLDHLDILINNAGLLVNKSFIETTQDEIEKMFRVNCFMPAMLIKYLLPFMGKTDETHVVNISSMGGFQGSAKFPGLAYYSAGKAALACMTECLQEEFKNSAITFNCLALGSVQTEMLEQAFPGYKASVSSSEMADFIGNFALKAHQYIKGKIIPVSISTP